MTWSARNVALRHFARAAPLGETSSRRKNGNDVSNHDEMRTSTRGGGLLVLRGLLHVLVWCFVSARDYVRSSGRDPEETLASFQAHC